MENKINIAKILKNCPSGMELDCTMYDNLYFNQIYDDGGCIYEIGCYTIVDEIRTTVNFTKFGTFNTHANSKCVIFPKGKTTWEGFVPPCKFKDGDILFVKSVYSWVLVYKESKNNEDLYKYVAIQDNHNHTYIVYDNNPLCCKEDVSEIRLATEEEKQKLFDTIKANGYKWNAKTKTLEKLVESNEDVDDRVVMSGIYFDRENYADEVELHLGNYEIEIRDGKTYAIFKNQETKTLEKLPKFKVGDRITKRGSIENWIVSSVSSEYYGLKLPKGIEGIGVLPVVEQDDWELVPNKFDITALVPFESKVLMRSSNAREWVGTIYSHYNNNYFFGCGMMCHQCIPYEGNEHLLGKTDDCNDFYKTW